MIFKLKKVLAATLLICAFTINAQIVINEVDADQVGTDSQEFVELFGTPNTVLDGTVLVFYNGSGDTSYRAVDLDGQTLDANGFFVYGSASVPNVDLSAGAVTNLIQNGRDAVALYTGNDTDFPNGTVVTNTNIIDALVYDTNDSDDAGLLAALTPGQAQINEGGMGNKDGHSNSRVPDGGTALNTTTYTQQLPTPGVTNSPVVVSFSIDDVTQVETDAGTANFAFTVTISATADATVDWATSDGTATTADSDYTAVAATTLTFTNGGPTTQIVTVVVNGDTNIEADETFNIDLTNATNGATIADNQGIGTITNDDIVAANISINDVIITEGDTGVTTLDFTVSLDVTADVTVQVDTSDATATTADSDYVAIAAQTVTFTNGGPLTQTVSVTINGDTVIEADETFNVDLTNAVGATITDAQGVGTINNDDSASFSVDDVSIVEGSGGTTSLLNFTVSKTGNAAATVDWATSDGTATTADNDYVAVAATTLNFTAAQTTQNVSVTINGDTLIETDETFNVDLSNATSGATITDNQGIGTITNDDTVQATIVAEKDVSGDLTPGGLITYTIALTNIGPNIQNDNPGDEMTDTLPSSLTFISATASSGTVTNVGNVVSWNGSIPFNISSEIITIVAQISPNAAGTIENTAVVFYDSDGDNINESTANSNPPGVINGPTAFFIPFMVPSLSQFALLLLMLSLASVVYFKTKQKS